MIRTTLTAIASAAALFAVSEPIDSVRVVMIDRAKAYCTLAWHDDSMRTIAGPCAFSQYGGNVYVDDFNSYKFVFPAAEEGKTYTRNNAYEMLSFRREGHYTLNVFWEKPGPKVETKVMNSFPLKCQLNEIASTCRTEPNKEGGFVLFFSHGDQPILDLTPVGPPTTDRREMVDSTGKRWALSIGLHSGGFGVSSSDRFQPWW